MRNISTDKNNNWIMCLRKHLITLKCFIWWWHPQLRSSESHYIIDFKINISRGLKFHDPWFFIILNAFYRLPISWRCCQYIFLLKIHSSFVSARKIPWIDETVSLPVRNNIDFADCCFATSVLYLAYNEYFFLHPICEEINSVRTIFVILILPGDIQTRQ